MEGVRTSFLTFRTPPTLFSFFVLVLFYFMEKFIKNIQVLFENDFCLVLNKPSGLAVQGGEGVKVSLDSILSEKISPRPLLVHRLDRDTSGVILVAKTKAAAAAFSALFAGREGKAGKNPSITKQYLGLCSGSPEPESGLIRHKLDVRGSGKESITHYKLLSNGTLGGDIPYSLLELKLDTGRMHQIRRHMAQIGHPLLGDDKYGDFSLNKRLRKLCGRKHLLLHASRLIIPLFTGFLPCGLDISAPLPDYFSLQ